MTDLYRVKVAQLCPTLCDPMNCTVHRILQARILKWVAFPFSRGSSQSRDWTQVSRIAGGFFINWATREAQGRCQIVSWTSLKIKNLCSAIKALLIEWQDKIGTRGTTLAIQWLRLGTCNAGSVDLIPSQGTKIPHASQCDQKKKGGTRKKIFVKTYLKEDWSPKCTIERTV